MAVLQVNAFFKKAAPAPAKKGTAKKAAPAPKKASPFKKAAPAPKKVAPKKTVVRKAAPVKKSSGKSAQAGSDASKWYGTYHLLPPPSPKSAKSSKSARIRHPTTPPTIVGSRARARDRATPSSRGSIGSTNREPPRRLRVLERFSASRARRATRGAPRATTPPRPTPMIGARSKRTRQHRKDMTTSDNTGD
jgi:hypothetical protein